LKWTDERFVLAGETSLLHTINLFVQAMVKNRTPLNTRGPFLSAGQEILAATMALENKFLSNSQEDIEQPTQETDTQETEEDNNFSDDLSDSGDDSDVEFAAVPKAFETVAPRNLKRTYGIIVDDLRSERRIKTAKLDEQLQYLRHIIPDTYRVGDIIFHTS
jgi:hypothetical protein